MSKTVRDVGHPKPFLMIHSRGTSAADSKWPFLRNCENANVDLKILLGGYGQKQPLN